MSHPLAILAVAVLVLVLLDLATLRWGADSRPARLEPGTTERPDWDRS